MGERTLRAEGLRLVTEAGAIVSDPDAGEGAYRVVSPERVGELAELTHPLLGSLYLTPPAPLRAAASSLRPREPPLASVTQNRRASRSRTSIPRSAVTFAA